MNKKYEITSYSRDSISILGHITHSEETDDLKKAKDIAKKRVKQGDINIWILEDNKPYMQYAHKV